MEDRALSRVKAPAKKEVIKVGSLQGSRTLVACWYPPVKGFVQLCQR